MTDDHELPWDHSLVSTGQPYSAGFDPRVTDTSDPRHWSHQGADYDGTACKRCGRHRVVLFVEVNRRICEKCMWDQDLNDFAGDCQSLNT